MKLLEVKDTANQNLLKIFREIGRERSLIEIGESRRAIKKLAIGMKSEIDKRIRKNSRNALV